jgi:hypothetical protein
VKAGAGFLMAAAILVAWRGVSGGVADYMDEVGCQIIEAAEKTEFREVATLVAAIGALESGWGSAVWVEPRRQVFAMKANRRRLPGEKPIDLILGFSSFAASAVAALSLFRKRGFPADRDGFLDRLDSSGYHKTGDEYRVRLLSVEKRIIKNLKRCGK